MFKPDEYQQAVIDHDEGKAVVAAAAGAGKSTVLVHRTLNLITKGADPHRIILLAYNRDAAESLRGKLGRNDVRVQTFHAYCLAVLKHFFMGGQTGQTRWQIVGSDGAPRAAPMALKVIKDYKLQDTSWSSYVTASERIRDAAIDIRSDDDHDLCRQIIETVTGVGTPREAYDVLTFARAYQDEKRRRQCLDYADMLYAVVRIIRDGGEQAELLANTFEHVMIDESQDCTLSRWLIAEHLAKNAKSFMAIGDSRQALYSWQSAVPAEFIRRAQEYQLFSMPVNRRSARAIVELGNHICLGEEWAIGGNSLTLQDAPAGVVEVHQHPTPLAEAIMVVEDIQEKMRDGVPLFDEGGQWNFAAIARTNAGLARLESRLYKKKIPARVLGPGGTVWGMTQGREFLAYLRLANGDASGLTVVANKPLRYMRRTTSEQIVANVDNGMSLHEAVVRAGRNAQDLMADLGSVPSRFEDQVLWAKKLLDRYVDEEADELGGDEAEDKRDMYKCLKDAALEAGSLQGILTQIKQAAERQDKEPAVILSTVHRMKGLEAQTVYFVGVTKDVLPHKKSTNLQEEKRLFYTGCTRASSRLVLACSDKEPSPFIPSHLLPKLTSEDVDGEPCDLCEESVPSDFLVDGICDQCEDSFTTKPRGPSAFQPNWDEATKVATAETAPANGKTFFAVTPDQLSRLVGPLGFTETEPFAGQRVWSALLANNIEVKIYSTISTGQDISAGCGEDSIRIAAVYNDRPVLAKQPYTARTRQWRHNLVDKLWRAITKLAATPDCPICGGMTVLRVNRDTEDEFFGCMSYPRCSGSQNAV